MNCNNDIHEELKVTEVLCPFCDKRIAESNPIRYQCCNNQKIINDNTMKVCQSCGVIQEYNYSREYVDFYQNMSRFQRKSVYHRKYHINNHLMQLQDNHGINVTCLQKHKIDCIYNEIGDVIRIVNSSRKRMISINFIMRKIFEMMGIPYKNIPISKSKKTLDFYDRYWTTIMSLIGDKIKSIIG